MILLMIVRNEAQNIMRSLDSALACGISKAVILDTGSTDDTVHLISHHPLNVTWKVVPWTNFAEARTQLMDYAGSIFPDEYGIMLDADDELTAVHDLDLMCDAYKVNIEYGATTYDRVGIFDLNLPWTFRGVVHEFPVCDDTVIGKAAAVIRIGGGGARSRDPLKYLHDADAINNALMHETNQFMRNRYCFYLAQSYRDASHSGAAIYWYEQTTKAEGWTEEVYVSCLNLARLTGNRDWYSKAAAINPDRAEAWRALGKHDMADKCVVNPANLFVEIEAYGADARNRI